MKAENQTSSGNESSSLKKRKTEEIPENLKLQVDNVLDALLGPNAVFQSADKAIPGADNVKLLPSQNVAEDDEFLEISPVEKLPVMKIQISPRGKYRLVADDKIQRKRGRPKKPSSSATISHVIDNVIARVFSTESTTISPSPEQAPTDNGVADKDEVERPLSNDDSSSSAKPDDDDDVEDCCRNRTPGVGDSECSKEKCGFCERRKCIYKHKPSRAVAAVVSSKQSDEEKVVENGVGKLSSVASKSSYQRRDEIVDTDNMNPEDRDFACYHCFEFDAKKRAENGNDTDDDFDYHYKPRTWLRRKYAWYEEDNAKFIK